MHLRRAFSVIAVIAVMVATSCGGTSKVSDTQAKTSGASGNNLVGGTWYRDDGPKPDSFAIEINYNYSLQFVDATNFICTSQIGGPSTGKTQGAGTYSMVGPDHIRAQLAGYTADLLQFKVTGNKLVLTDADGKNFSFTRR